MATSSDDTMMNATLVTNLPPPMITSVNDNKPPKQSPSSYQDLIKNLDVKKISNGSNMAVPASIQMQQQMPQQQMPQQQMQQQMPQQQMQQQMPQQQMQQQMPQQMPQQQFPPEMPQQQFPQPSPDNAMAMLHAQNSTYSGTMPQSAPIGQFSSGFGVNMAQGPIVNSLLPDPMLFNPPKEKKKRRQSPPEAAAPLPVSENTTASKIPSLDLNKIKPAILVTAIVFALLSWGAPVVAKQLSWTVDAVTGKFTSSGLVIISLLTGGIYLGISEIIRNFGNGV